MSQPMISVCVDLHRDADPHAVQRLVIGPTGKLRPHPRSNRFWALTPMTLRNVRALKGVKSCTLSPMSW